jgi:hypothetical protein
MSNSLAYNLNEVLQAAIDYNLGNIYTCLPGIVQSFNAKKGTVEVKPSIKKLLADGKTMDLPVLKDVPIVMPQTSQGGLSLPISSGDGVLIMFSQRSIDAWKAGKTDSKPNSTRKFSISDAFAIPGTIPATERSLLKKTYNGASVLSGNKLFIGNPNSPKVGSGSPLGMGNTNVDLISMLIQILDLLDRIIKPGALMAAGTYPVALSVPTSTISAASADIALYKSALSNLLYSPQ